MVILITTISSLGGNISLYQSLHALLFCSRLTFIGTLVLQEVFWCISLESCDFIFLCKQGLHLDPSIYLMTEESGGFGSGAVQMKAASAGAVPVAPKELANVKINQNPDAGKDSNVQAGNTNLTDNVSLQFFGLR